jgi:hypothetical protein
MSDLTFFGENMKACAVYDPETGIFESIIIMPEKECATYATGNNLVFEWINSLDAVPLENLEQGKRIRRASAGQYLIEDVPQAND